MADLLAGWQGQRLDYSRQGVFQRGRKRGMAMVGCCREENERRNASVFSQHNRRRLSVMFRSTLRLLSFAVAPVPRVCPVCAVVLQPHPYLSARFIGSFLLCSVSRLRIPDALRPLRAFYRLFLGSLPCLLLPWSARPVEKRCRVHRCLVICVQTGFVVSLAGVWTSPPPPPPRVALFFNSAEVRPPPPSRVLCSLPNAGCACIHSRDDFVSCILNLLRFYVCFFCRLLLPDGPVFFFFDRPILVTARHGQRGARHRHVPARRD